MTNQEREDKRKKERQEADKTIPDQGLLLLVSFRDFNRITSTPQDDSIK